MVIRKLVRNTKNAFMMNIPVTQSDVQQKIEEIKNDLNDKLGLENGLIQLSIPVKLENPQTCPALGISTRKPN